MNYLALLVIIAVSVGDTKEVSCEKLQEGKYHAVLDREFKDKYGGFELIIAEDTASIKVAALTEVYNIRRIKECNFIFTNPQLVDTSNLTAVGKQLATLGRPYFEINQRHADTLYFVHRVNAHIMISSGRFIRNKQLSKRSLSACSKALAKKMSG